MLNKNMKIAFSAALAATVGVMAAVVLPGALAGPAVSYKQDIYKITVTSPKANGSIPEWASLATGTWRTDREDQTFISGDDSYVVIDAETGSVYHRKGSPSFIGVLHDAPEGVLALRAHLKGDPTLSNLGFELRVGKNSAGKTTLDAVDNAGELAFSVTIDQRVSDEEAEAAHLLDTTPSRPEVTDTELAVGAAPTVGVTAYWFGRMLDGKWHAAAAVQHTRTRTEAQIAAGMSPRGEAQAYVVLYERAGVLTTSAHPGGKTRPAGELQVTSEPVSTAHAQGLVDAFNGRNGDETYAPWPRSIVTLADGQSATVVPSQFDGDGQVRDGFFVITPTTLVSVTGEVAFADIQALAANLRQLG